MQKAIIASLLSTVSSLVLGGCVADETDIQLADAEQAAQLPAAPLVDP